MKLVSNPKYFFDYLRSKFKPNHTATDILLDGNLISDDDIKVEKKFADHFQTYFTDSQNSHNLIFPSWAQSSKQILFANSNSLLDIEFDCNLIHTYLTSLSNRFNNTPDSIQAIFIKNCDIFFSQFATDIFRLSLDSAILPEIWRLSCIIPLFKRKGNTNSIEHFHAPFLKLWKKLLRNIFLSKILSINFFTMHNMDFFPENQLTYS